MMEALNQFHFIRPLWLLVLPIILIVWWLLLQSLRNTHWEQYITKELLDALRVHNTQQSYWWRWCLLLAWGLTIIAAAGPTWNKISVPTVKNQQATVILLDLSRSMLIEDISPNRLARAKFKLIDVLKRQSDGQTALIAYAGDAYTVSPLTNDPRTIESLLPALHPSIMPSQGSNIEAAITHAVELLKNANISSGDLLLLTDGIATDALSVIPTLLKQPYKLSILSIGSTEAGPIPVTDGGFLRGASGEIILASVNQSELQQLASGLRGRYASLSTNDSDIDYLLQQQFDSNSTQNEQDSSSTTVSDQWADMGHWLALLLIPLAVLCFRKGVIYLLPLVFLIPTPEAQAQTSYWEKLWQNKDQQATSLIEQKQFAKAAETFKRSDWAGTAHYQAGNYAAAVNELSKNNDVTSLYNLGNAQAFTGDLQTAVKTYTQVLQLVPNHEDALHNKGVIEQLLKQQNKQDPNQQSGDPSGEQSNESSEGNSSDSQQENPENKQGDQENGDNQSIENSQQSEENKDANQSAQQQDGQSSQSDSQSPKDLNTQEEQKNETASDEPQGDTIDSNNEDKNGTESQKNITTEQQAQTEDPKDSNSESSYALQATPSDLKDTSEQWLRSIKDNPSGLLQRKFQYQKQLRAQQQQLNQSRPQPSQSQRY